MFKAQVFLLVKHPVGFVGEVVKQQKRCKLMQAMPENLREIIQGSSGWQVVSAMLPSPYLRPEKSASEIWRVSHGC
jgi:hypothetical protein